MRATNLRSLIVLLSAVVLAAGCGASSTSLVAAPSATPPLVTLSTATADPTVTPTPSPMAIGTARPTTTPAALVMPGVELVGKTAVTAVDGVRVRSQPRVSDDSLKQEPLLPRGTALYVLDGPVVASGYEWYYVAPLSSRALPTGWVASASRDGVAWIAAKDFDCPSPPTNFGSLSSMPPGIGLACFPVQPITVEARLVECNCDVDGGWFEPSWFTFSGGPLLVDPRTTKAPSDTADWFALHMDPNGQHDDVLPVEGVYPPLGQIVEVTGIFDHPAAASCTFTEMEGKPVPTQDCRLAFAVTRLVVVKP